MLNSENADGQPLAVGAFIFAGGFTLGVKEQFNVLCHLEDNAYGVATMEHNQPEIPVFYGPDHWPHKELRNFELDLIYGNPPCAAWSQANQSPNRDGQPHDWRNDPRVSCTERHFSLLVKHKPQFWIWESVVPAFTKGREFVDNLTRRAKRHGYSVTYVLHDARYLGVPQKRPRFFFVAHRRRFEPLVLTSQEITVAEALRGLNDIGDSYPNGIDKHAWLIPEVRQGENMWACFNRVVPEEDREYNERGHVVGRPAFLYRRPRPDEPSCVVMNDKLHPTEDRAMTMNELKALCGFPAMYEFVGSGPVNQMARGVCPPVGRWIAEQVASSLGRRRIQKPTVRTVDLRNIS